MPKLSIVEELDIAIKNAVMECDPFHDKRLCRR